MCGIFGAIDLSGNQLPFSDNIYSNALNAIKHRGPDDEGRWMNDNKSVFSWSKKAKYYRSFFCRAPANV